MQKAWSLYNFSLFPFKKLVHFCGMQTCIAWENSRRFPAKWRLRSKRRNSILMTRHYPDLSSASDFWLVVPRGKFYSTNQIWKVTRHQHGISALVSQTSFSGEISGSVAKCLLFSQVKTRILENSLFIAEGLAQSEGRLTGESGRSSGSIPKAGSILHYSGC